MNKFPRPSFTFIMTGAAAQGLALHFLSLAGTEHTWPYTSAPAWFALLLVAVFVSPLAYSLGGWWRERLTWLAIFVTAAVLAGLGLFHGRCVADQAVIERGAAFASNALLFVGGFALLFHALPFIQARLSSGTWQPEYPRYFFFAWQNALAIALSILFSIVTWILLWVWAALFKMLGIDFFEVTFFTLRSNVAYLVPVIGGASFLLAGTAGGIRAVLHTQLLALLKWFAVLAATILVLFAVALIFEARALFTVHRHAISATWLLMLALIMIYLYNAGYGDGTDAKPYPPFIGRALRAVTPLLIIVSALALFGLWVRVDEYGLTVPRILGIAIAIVPLGYACGYTWTASRGTQWMAGMGRVNSVAAVGVMAIVLSILSPILTPYRLSAHSIERRIVAAPLDKKGRLDEDPFYALRFDTGSYGHDALARLTELGSHPQQELIHRAARAALVATDRWSGGGLAKAEPTLVGYPEGATIDTALWKKILFKASAECRYSDSCIINVLYADLTGSGQNDALVIHDASVSLYREIAGRWVDLGQGSTRGAYRCTDAADFAAALKSGDYRVVAPVQRNFQLGTRLFAFATPDPAPRIERKRGGCGSNAADESAGTDSPGDESP